MCVCFLFLQENEFGLGVLYGEVVWVGWVLFESGWVFYVYCFSPSRVTGCKFRNEIRGVFLFQFRFVCLFCVQLIFECVWFINGFDIGFKFAIRFRFNTNLIERNLYNKYLIFL